MGMAMGLALAMSCVAGFAFAEQPQTSAGEEPIVVSTDVAFRVGKKVWENETGGKPLFIAQWNNGEDFASLGVGHFIWFTERPEPYSETFPLMIEFLKGMRDRLAAPIPQWLDQTPVPHCPWKTKKEFDDAVGSPRMIELRAFLDATFGPQTLFLVHRMKESLQKIEANLDDPKDREHVRRQFYRIVHSSPDLYPLIDYVDFKGDGTDPKARVLDRDTGRMEGWGLKQVLLDMKGTKEGPEALLEFSDATRARLDRRIRNDPSMKSWALIWHIRCASYKKPLPK